MSASPNRLPTLVIVNAIGCLALAGFIVVQWLDGHATEAKLEQAQKETILEKNGRTEAEHKVKLFESDIAGLKASIESLQQASDLAQKELAEKNSMVDAANKTLTDAEGKVKEWEDALKARDEAIAQRDEKLVEASKKLTEANSTILATRKRLDEALAELKKAGAR